MKWLNDPAIVLESRELERDETPLSYRDNSGVGIAVRSTYSEVTLPHAETERL
jgi:hypothetical protein